MYNTIKNCRQYKPQKNSRLNFFIPLLSGNRSEMLEFSRCSRAIKKQLKDNVKKILAGSDELFLFVLTSYLEDVLGNPQKKQLFDLQKIKLLQKVYDYIPIEDQMKITEIDAHSLNRLKSLHIQYSLMNYTDKSAELIESVIPQLCTALDDIEARYIQTIDKEAKVETLYLRKL